MLLSFQPVLRKGDNIMKFLSMLFSFVLVATIAHGAPSFQVPRGQDGVPLRGDEYGGASSKLITTADGTEQVVFAGRGVVYGVLLSSGAITSYAVLSDSGPVTSPTGAVTSQMVYESTATKQFKFPKGVRVADGATLAITGGAGVTATVFYQDEQE